MKILHVCLGGGWYERNAYQDQLLPRYHRRLGHDVTVIASYYGRWNLEKGCYDIDNVPETLLSDGIKVFRISPVFPLKINAHLHLFKGLKNIIVKEKPNLIFLHGLVCLNYVSVVSYKKQNPNVKIVCDNHADKNNSQHHWTTKLWSRIVINKIIVKKLIPISEWFYGVTPVRRDFLVDEYCVPKEKTKLLVLGADDDSMKFDDRSAIRSNIREKFAVSVNDFLIVTGGRIDIKKSKYYLSVAKSVEQINDPRLKLLIFGPVSEDVKPLFNSFDKRKIMLAGEVASNRVYDYFYAADVVAFPGLHSVMWEQAVASKVPCVFHYIEGFDHVDIGGNCIWAYEDTSEEYQQIFERLLENSEMYKELKRRANDKEAEKFLYSKIAEQVINDVKEQ